MGLALCAVCDTQFTVTLQLDEMNWRRQELVCFLLRMAVRVSNYKDPIVRGIGCSEYGEQRKKTTEKPSKKLL